MKGYTQTRLEQIAVEFASACMKELPKKNPSEPLMVLSVPDPVTNTVFTADFIEEVNEDRLKEYDWVQFFDAMLERTLDSLGDQAKTPVPESRSSSSGGEGRYSPSAQESEWAGKVAIAIKRGKMEKVRLLLDAGPSSESIFQIEFPFQAEQPSVPEEGEEERVESIRGFFTVDGDSRQLLFSLYPFLRRSEIERLGYPRLVHCAICWFILRNSGASSLQIPRSQGPDSSSTAAAAASEEVDDVAAELRSLTMSGIGFCDEEDMY